MKRVAWLVAALLGGLAILAWVGWWWIGRPVYVPGSLASRADLAPIGSALAPTLEVAPGITLHSFVDGRGPLTVVVHGGPGIPPSAPWPGLVPLTDERQFLYYHQRGSGRSTRPIDVPEGEGFTERLAHVEGTLGLGQQLADIERIRRIYGAPQIALVGHSFGAFLAALYAAEFPDAVSELVLIAPAGVLRLPSDDGDLFAMIRARLAPEAQSEFDAFVSGYFDFGPTLFERREATQVALQEELGGWYARVAELPRAPSAEPGGWMVWAMYISMGRRHDYTEALAAIRAPTLVVHGSEDLQPLSVSEAYAAAIPGAELRVVQGGGHFVHYTHPGVVSDLIRDL